LLSIAKVISLYIISIAPKRIQFLNLKHAIIMIDSKNEAFNIDEQNESYEEFCVAHNVDRNNFGLLVFLLQFLKNEYNKIVYELFTKIFFLMGLTFYSFKSKLLTI